MSYPSTTHDVQVLVLDVVPPEKMPTRLLPRFGVRNIIPDDGGSPANGITAKTIKSVRVQPHTDKSNNQEGGEGGVGGGGEGGERRGGRRIRGRKKGAAREQRQKNSGKFFEVSATFQVLLLYCFSSAFYTMVDAGVNA